MATVPHTGDDMTVDFPDREFLIDPFLFTVIIFHLPPLFFNMSNMWLVLTSTQLCPIITDSLTFFKIKKYTCNVYFQSHMCHYF